MENGSNMRISFLLVLSALTLHAQQSDAEAASWNRPIAPFRLIGNVYYVGTAGLASYLIVTPQGDILLDGGLPESAPLIERGVAALGFRMKDIKILLNSHAHFDHAGGLAALKRDSGAKLMASRADTALLEKGRQVYFSRHADSSFPPVSVDRVIEDGAAVQLGGVTMTAHLTPGHTKGCTTWTMPVVERGKTHQVLFFCSMSAPDYLLTHNPKYPDIVADYESSFAKLSKLQCDVFLAPHGSFFDLEGKRRRMREGGPNPFVDPAEFQAFLAIAREEFETKLRQQTTASRAGK